jgi:hypothetical protein
VALKKLRRKKHIKKKKIEKEIGKSKANMKDPKHLRENEPLMEQ